MSSSEAVLRHAAGLPEEPSEADKAAFVRAMYRGLEPGSEAARSVSRKRGDLAEAAVEAEAATPAAPVAELLRRIPAQPAAADLRAGVPAGDALSHQALALAAAVEAGLAEGRADALHPAAQQALLGALCRLYAAADEAGARFDALGPQSAVTATDAMIMCGALLKAVDLQVFELAVWQSWSAR